MTVECSTLRATVVVLARNGEDFTARCLASLQPTLRSGDQVVVVENGSNDLTASQLSEHPWVEFLTSETSQGFAKACNQGAELANGVVLVFLNNDTIVSPGWLDELLEPFSDFRVGAVGPRSNAVVGHQQIDVANYPALEPESRDRFVAERRAAHHAEVEECARLAGSCLAVRTELFRKVEGFDEGYGLGGGETDDLCMKIRTSGFRLVVAHGSFVHHESNGMLEANDVNGNDRRLDQERFEKKWGASAVPPLALLSVCLIVKDEEEMVKGCLESVIGLADEIIVYDTGSTDRTIEIARAMGARVIEGYWDDNFSRARNAALAVACGEWVLSLDADELLLGDFEALRHQLMDRRSTLDGYLTAIENLHGAGRTRSVHNAVRLFRRTSCTWRHRLHEQPEAADDLNRPLNLGYLSAARLIHLGYEPGVFENRKKAERNLAIAEAALEDEELLAGYAQMNYGRALEVAGRSDDAIVALRRVTTMNAPPSVERMALLNLQTILCKLARFDEALEVVEDFRRISMSQIAGDVAEATIRLSMGDVSLGLAILARVPPRGRDDDGMVFSAHMLSAMRAGALASVGRYQEAADVVLATVREEGILEADLGELLTWLKKANRPATEIVDALDVDDLIPMLGRVMRLPPMLADEILEGAWERFPERLEPLAAASKVAPQLAIARALVWSARLRQRGLGDSCPLVLIAADGRQEPRVRVLAAAAAYGSFGERRVVRSVHEARALLDAEGLEASTGEIDRLAPGLLDAAPEEVEYEPQGTKSPQIAASSVPRRGRSARVSHSFSGVAADVRRGGVNVVGSFESGGAYGSVARLLVTSLRRSGVTVATTSYHPDGRVGSVEWEHEGESDQPFDTTLLVVAPEDVANFVIDVGVTAFEGRYMIGVWLWDFDEPSEAMSIAGQALHEIWVPSDVTARGVKKATDRLVTKISLLPTTVTGPSDIHRDEPLDDNVTFYSYVDYDRGFLRQNPLGVIEAFTGAFRSGDGPRLCVLTSNAERDPLAHAELVKAAARSDLSVINDDLATSKGLIGGASAKTCFVSLHRSEGTGLMMSRARVLGTPTIVSNHSFGRELFSKSDSFLVPCTLVDIPELERRNSRARQWAEPDVAMASSFMRLVVERPKEVLLKEKRSRELAHHLAVSRAPKMMAERLAAIEKSRHVGSKISSVEPFDK